MTKSVSRFVMTAAVAALMLAACSAADTGSDKAQAATPAQASGAAVTLQTRPNLSPDIEAMPRLVGDGAAVQAINAELDRADASAVRDAAVCAADAGDGPGGGWSRGITRPMTGPAYLTLRQHLDIYCGGPYPSIALTAVTYDLATGRRIDWTAAIPGLELSLSAFEDMPRDYVQMVSSAALGAWYSRKMLANPDAEWVEQCRDVFDPETLADQTFNIWADAMSGGVTVSPDFAHVSQACAESATLTPGEMRSFNANPALVEAITAGHAAGNWAPKEEE